MRGKEKEKEKRFPIIRQSRGFLKFFTLYWLCYVYHLLIRKQHEEKENKEVKLKAMLMQIHWPDLLKLGQWDIQETGHNHKKKLTNIINKNYHIISRLATING